MQNVLHDSLENVELCETAMRTLNALYGCIDNVEWNVQCDSIENVERPVRLPCEYRWFSGTVLGKQNALCDCLENIERTFCTPVLRIWNVLCGCLENAYRSVRLPRQCRLLCTTALRMQNILCDCLKNIEHYM